MGVGAARRPGAPSGPVTPRTLGCSTDGGARGGLPRIFPQGVHGTHFSPPPMSCDNTHETLPAREAWRDSAPGGFRGAGHTAPSACHVPHDRLPEGNRAPLRPYRSSSECAGATLASSGSGGHPPPQIRVPTRPPTACLAGGCA